MDENNKNNDAGKNGGAGDRAYRGNGRGSREIQAFGTIVKLSIALEEKACAASVANLNQLLADTMTLRDLYKKHHWQASGAAFYPLHLLFDKHFQEQSALVDLLAERIQTLGGVGVAMAQDVAETTLIPRAPRGREETPAQLSRLLHAHEIVLKESRAMARQADRDGDDGTNDIVVSDVIRTNELQVWFAAQHLVEAPPGSADDRNGGPAAAKRDVSAAPLKAASPVETGKDGAPVVTSPSTRLSDYVMRSIEK